MAPRTKKQERMAEKRSLVARIIYNQKIWDEHTLVFKNAQKQLMRCSRDTLYLLMFATKQK